MAFAMRVKSASAIRDGAPPGVFNEASFAMNLSRLDRRMSLTRKGNYRAGACLAASCLAGM